MPDAFCSRRVLLSRQANFSVGLRLSNPAWSDQKNRQIFGVAVGPHGAEFHARVAFSGAISNEDGMIVNLVEVKSQLARVVTRIEDKFLDQEVKFFRDNRPTIENVARFLWEHMPVSIGSGQLFRIQLDQHPRARVELIALKAQDQDKNYSMKVSRSYEFAAAHRLFMPTLSDQQNWERFDKCSNLAGHGHNFQLQVWVEGLPDADSGFIINPRLLDSIVEEEVYERFDHKHLNEDCPEFKESGLVPTSENLALVIFELLQNRLKRAGHLLVRVGLQETQKNYFEVEAQ